MSETVALTFMAFGVLGLALVSVTFFLVTHYCFGGRHPFAAPPTPDPYISEVARDAKVIEIHGKTAPIS